MIKAIVLAGLLSTASFAATITFDSSTSTSNSTASPHYLTVAATPAPYWATALPGSIWITTSGTSAPPINTTVTFTQDLNLAGTWNKALLNLGVFADDTAVVMLDGTTLFDQGGPNGSYCASTPIGCTDGTEGTLSNFDVSSLVHNGTNTLEFQIFQRGSETPFGLDFAGSLATSQVANSPEPSSALLLCGGLVGVGLIRRRFLNKKVRIS